jgi:hypothetical protein
MRFLVFITVAVALTYPANGQICNCESNFEWVKKTFEENDAGFQYIIDKKGQAAYNIHNQLMLENIKAAKTLTECSKLLREWSTFFRSGHFQIQLLTQEQNVSQTANNTATYETWEVDIPQFEKYISSKKEVDYEGIWDIGGIEKIGIKKDGMNYIGFIIESDVDGWREPGLVKLKIEQDGDKLKSTFIMRDHSPVYGGEPELIGDKYILIGMLPSLKRLSPVFPDDPLLENYIKARTSRNPYLDELNATTLYLRIPSFNSGYKSAIDKLLTDNKDKILNTENLIIDLRNNGGGDDDSYSELLPFLYTNPIRIVSMEYLSTVQNNQPYVDMLSNPDLNENSRQQIKIMQDRLGEFVNPSGRDIYIEQHDVVYEYPKNVGIIIDKGCGSTTEQFLLASKQSKKVKLFGTTTFGALDISNMRSAESPCKEFQLIYCISRSMRIPDMAIDDIGLQPDYYLDKTIPQDKWVEFVNEV